MNAREQMVNAGGERVTMDKLRADLRVLVADMEQLLAATAHQTGQDIAQVRSNAVESLQSAKARLASLQDATLAKARAAGRETDRYVHSNPWPVIAIFAAAGVALGMVLARDGHPEP
jgi:ElaB/YqjD/DUF883 family membrane-anchored ribosome-binding protein